MLKIEWVMVNYFMPVEMQVQKNVFGCHINKPQAM